jgi:hypothetical protein
VSLPRRRRQLLLPLPPVTRLLAQLEATDFRCQAHLLKQVERSKVADVLKTHGSKGAKTPRRSRGGGS